MADIKHIGRIKSNGRKCVIVFRTLPGDAFNALVVITIHCLILLKIMLLKVIQS